MGLRNEGIRKEFFDDSVVCLRANPDDFQIPDRGVGPTFSGREIHASRLVDRSAVGVMET